MLACGFLPDVLREALGEGEHAGVRLTYVTEPERRGTAGAIRFAADALGDRLDDRFLALNGDVLTDLDLTALLRAHERARARGRPSPCYPVEDSAAYGLVRSDGDGAVLEFLEKTGEAVPGEINAGAYVLERSVLDLIPPGREVSIEREVFPRLVGDGLYGAAPGRLLDGHRHPRALPAGELGHPRGAGRRRGCGRPRPGCFVGAGAEIAAGATVGPRAVVSRRAARSPPAREVRDSVLLDGCTRRRGRPGQRLDPRPGRHGRGRGRRSPARSSAGMRESRPSVTMIDDVLGIPDQLRDALWRVESARLEPADAAGLIVCGMGGSAIGGDLAAAALGDRLTRPLVAVRGYALPSWATPEWTVLCSSYSGDDRGDARLLRGGRGARRPPHRRQHRRHAGRPGPRGRGAGGRPARDLPAPRRGRLHVHRRRRGRRAGRRRARGSTPRSTPPPPSSPSEAEPCSARAAEIAAQLEGTVPVVYGADLTAPVARRWKTPGQRERQAPRLLLRAARGRPQRDLRLGRGRGGRRPRRRLPRGPRPAPARCAAASSSPPPRSSADGATAVRVETAGETRVARLLWATMLGDLVSLELARARGVDPLPVEAIERFKEAMGPA